MGEEKKELIKGLIKRLHSGEAIESVKEKFKEVISDISPLEIANIEEELVKEGMPFEEIQKLCDVHLLFFKESIEKAKPLAPENHPINILMKEHNIFIEKANHLREQVRALLSLNNYDENPILIAELMKLEKEIGLERSERHYLREENVLFPYLEKHGITQPPKQMWTEHNQIREIKKEIKKYIESLNSEGFKETVKLLNDKVYQLVDILSNHFYKENNILFPAAMRVIDLSEWVSIREEFDEIGYPYFKPGEFFIDAIEIGKEKKGGYIRFETGELTSDEIEGIFSNLPIDITFVDRDDRVKFFNQTKERIFVRTKAIIGRTVQNCHPEKSLSVVNQILEDFKSGKRDRADFWIDIEGKKILIRYFAIRDKSGEYLGCLETTQDITEIKKIEGQKRLLD